VFSIPLGSGGGEKWLDGSVYSFSSMVAENTTEQDPSIQLFTLIAMLSSLIKQFVSVNTLVETVYSVTMRMSTLMLLPHTVWSFWKEHRFPDPF